MLEAKDIFEMKREMKKNKVKTKTKKPLYKRWWFWAIIIVVLLGIIGSGADNNSENMAYNSSQKQTTVEKNKDEDSEKETSKETETTVKETKKTEKKTEATTEKKYKKGSDIEIVSREGHPRYYGSVKASHKIWKDAKKKVVFGDSTDKYTDKTILLMDAYRDSDVIRGVEIYFSNFKKDGSL